MERKMKRILALILSLVMILSVVPITVFAQESVQEIVTEQVEDNSVSIDPTKIVSISANSNFSSIIRADGSLWTCGSLRMNYYNDNYEYYTDCYPKMLLTCDTLSYDCYWEQRNWSDISRFALKKDNSLWAWGYNKNGSLGIGTAGDGTYISCPVKILDNVVQHETSDYSNTSCALTNDGSLYMWGSGDGCLFLGSRVPQIIMEDVLSFSLLYRAIAVIKNDGSLWMWGYNSGGVIGINSNERVISEPVKVMDNVKKVSCGSSHVLALTNNDELYVWGGNESGQLGLGHLNSKSSPVRNTNFEKIKDIDAAVANSAVILENGDLYLWGNNICGQIGDGLSANRDDYYRVMRNVDQVALGAGHVLALKKDNTLLAWGINNNYQLGIPNRQNHKKPEEVTIGKTNVSFYGDGQNNKIDITYDDNWFTKGTAGYYNKDLAITGLILSEDAYSYGGWSGSYGEFGFTTQSCDQSEGSVDRPGYMIGYKIFPDYGEPRVEIFMAIRGTVSMPFSWDFLTDIKSKFDAFDGAADYCYGLLRQAKSNIATELDKQGFTLTKANTKYLITGHSLGGACAGKLALRMVRDSFSTKENTYCYTYAAPNYTNFDFELDTENDGEIAYIFNIVNNNDIVPEVPQTICTLLPTPIPFISIPVPFVPVYKAGQINRLSIYDNESSFKSIIKELYGGEIPWDAYTPVKGHMTTTYLALLMSEKTPTLNNILLKSVRMFSVHCPVDIEIYDSKNELCAYTKGEEVVYTNYSPVRIIVVGDEKYVELPDESYTVKYTGTDSGTMRIEDQQIDLNTGEVQTEKVYDDVVLEKGKQFESNLDAEDLDKTSLFIVDEEGDKTSNVDINGEETILYKYDITDCDVIIENQNKKYDGKEKTQNVFVEGLTEGIDYRIIYKDNIDVGTATVTVKGINEYYGRISKTFEIYDNGNCGETSTWSLSSGKLTITGSGDIPSFDNENVAPWSEQMSKITEVEISEDITSIGSYSFANASALTNITIPDSVTSIGDHAFYGCDNLTIKCNKDSYAHQYAIANNIAYELIEPEEPAATPVTFYLDKKPSKIAYELNEDFDPTGAVIRIKYSDGTIKSISPDDVQIHDVNTSVSGANKVYFTYTENGVTVKSYIFTLLIDRQVREIFIPHKPNKTHYISGEAFEREGMQIIATYSDGTKADVSAEVRTSGFDSTTFGLKKMTVSYTYKGKTVTLQFSYEMNPKLTGLVLTHKPNKLGTYKVGEPLSKEGMIITAKFSDGSTKDVTHLIRTSGYSSKQVGKQIITVSYTYGTQTKKVQFSIIMSQ